MTILFLAPLPPPITGHSLVSEVLYRELTKHHEVQVVNLSKDSFVEGVDSFKRLVEVGKLMKEIFVNRKNKGAIYLTISESFAGNLKDICFYLICYGSLKKMFIHLHGGSIKRLLWNKHSWIYAVNKFFIRKMGGVIISGPSHESIFNDIVDENRIHIVPNFASEHLFVSEEEMIKKFSEHLPLRVLYISNFIEKKGYKDLANAFFALDENIRGKIRIDFAGKFDAESDKQAFVDKLSPFPQLCYHGLISEEQKKELYRDAHVFCLPTTFLEGQPISILEAYASACVVVTTGQSGIRDIFTPEINGYQIEGGSPESIKQALEKMALNRGNLLQIAAANRKVAGEKYRKSIYNTSLEKIITS